MKGIYAFHMSIMIKKENKSGAEPYLGVEMVKNSSRIAAIFMQGRVGSDSVTVFILCEPEEKVWVKVCGDMPFLNVNLETLSYFSGTFLYQAD